MRQCIVQTITPTAPRMTHTAMAMTEGSTETPEPETLSSSSLRRAATYWLVLGGDHERPVILRSAGGVLVGVDLALRVGDAS